MKETDINKWATLIIEKIEGLQQDWNKPWFTQDALRWPKNLTGREYNGMNALMRAPVMVI
nr:ArdC family protein [Bacteroides xylanisolvens]